MDKKDFKENSKISKELDNLIDSILSAPIKLNYTEKKRGNDAAKMFTKYYGGKFRVVPHLLPIIPKHEVYVEPFFGVGTLYFLKDLSYMEVINDLNAYVYLFFYCLKNHYKELENLVVNTTFNELDYIKSLNILNKYIEYTKDNYIKKKKGILDIDLDKLSKEEKLSVAWAFYYGINVGYLGKLKSGFGYSIDGKVVKSYYSKLNLFKDYLMKRLSYTHIFCRDFSIIVEKFDTKDTFFYFDPPYGGTNTGHYKNLEESYSRLIEDIIPNIKGKWLLSSYLTDNVKNLRKKKGVYSKEIIKLTRNNKTIKHYALECITANYKI